MLLWAGDNTPPQSKEPEFQNRSRNPTTKPPVPALGSIEQTLRVGVTFHRCQRMLSATFEKRSGASSALVVRPNCSRPWLQERLQGNPSKPLFVCRSTY